MFAARGDAVERACLAIGDPQEMAGQRHRAAGVRHGHAREQALARPALDPAAVRGPDRSPIDGQEIGKAGHGLHFGLLRGGGLRQRGQRQRGKQQRETANEAGHDGIPRGNEVWRFSGPPVAACTFGQIGLIG